MDKAEKVDVDQIHPEALKILSNAYKQGRTVEEAIVEIDEIQERRKDELKRRREESEQKSKEVKE